MKRFTAFLTELFCVILVLLTGCGAGGLQTEISASLHHGMTEELDPFALGDEYAMIKSPETQPVSESTPEVIEENENSVPEITESPENDTPLEIGIRSPGITEKVSKARGFRIHIGLFEDESEANEFAENARSKIEEKVYVIYKAPFFRVRVGDFTTRKEADQYVKYLKKNKFKIAWWIRTTINTQ